MANFDLKVIGTGGKEQRKPSSGLTIDFLSVRIGASNLEIKETTGDLDLGTVKLLVPAGTASGHAVNKGQLDGKVADSITDGVTDVAPSQNAVFDALALKINSSLINAANGVAPLDANGLVPVVNMPPAAIERLVVVADQAARYALTTATVQNGDTVKQTDTGLMYFVKDDTNLGNANGYEVYTAGTASSVAWSGVTGTPTTLSGYGITDYAAAAKAAAVSDSITDGITDVAPSQNAVFDALALKADASALPSAPYLSKTNDNAGAITVRQIVYVKSNGNVDLADASLDLFDGVIGIVKDASIATTAAGLITFAKGDLISGFSGLTPGKKYYLSKATPGLIELYSAITYASGDDVVCVGKALSASVLEFDPNFEFEY